MEEPARSKLTDLSAQNEKCNKKGVARLSCGEIVGVGLRGLIVLQDLQEFSNRSSSFVRGNRLEAGIIGGAGEKPCRWDLRVQELAEMLRKPELGWALQPEEVGQGWVFAVCRWDLCVHDVAAMCWKPGLGGGARKKVGVDGVGGDVEEAGIRWSATAGRGGEGVGFCNVSLGRCAGSQD